MLVHKFLSRSTISDSFSLRSEACASGSKRVFLLLCTDRLLRVGTLRNAHRLLMVGKLRNITVYSGWAALRNAHPRIERFALFDAQKNHVEVASPRGDAPLSPVSSKTRNICKRLRHFHWKSNDPRGVLSHSEIIKTKKWVLRHSVFFPASRTRNWSRTRNS